MEYQQYRRIQIAELRPYIPGEPMDGISISAPDKENGSPKVGDMIARNPANHDDKWVVAEKYFNDNFAPAYGKPETPAGDFYSRLKKERDDLDERLIALNSYLTNNPGHPNPRHRSMLEEQSRLMSDLLAVLDERICDIDISRRSSTENDHAE